MKIGYFTDNFPPRIGGVATYSFQLPYFFKKIHSEAEVEVFVFGSGIRPENAGDLKIDLLPQKSIFSLAVNIFKIIKNGNFDAVHTTTFFPVGFFVALFAKLFKVKSCLTVYGTEVVTTSGSLITKIVQSFTLRLIDKILAFSSSTKNLMLKRHKMAENKVKVIYPGISQLELSRSYDVREKFNIQPDDFVVLFVGRLVERKGALDLIKAIGQLPDNNIKLILVGGGDRQELENYVKENNLSSSIIFAGAVKREEILNYYKSAQVFSMPSFFDAKNDDVEGLGIVYLEAQISGLPVLGTSSGGIPEAIGANKSGFVVEPRDISALSNKIKLLKTDKDLYEKMSQRAVDFVSRNFSWQKNIESHFNIYQNNQK
ncbi:MAG: glycosyltransferase family 4 protein [Candidatus Buchananbacteria bacterium]|nr:glycosyltransferase family 4 protein [Candidatus Buchananbacteria bacterium]